MNIRTKKLVYEAVIAALYAALTLALAPISYGGVQFRVSEVLCILPFFFPGSVWGLTVGCLLANLLGPNGPLDVVVGTAASLLAALGTAAVGKAARKSDPARWGMILLACLMPVLFNGLLVGAELAYLFPLDAGFRTSFLVFGLQVAGGEAVVMYVLGLPAMRYLLKNEKLRGTLAGLQ